MANLSARDISALRGAVKRTREARPAGTAQHRVTPFGLWRWAIVTAVNASDLDAKWVNADGEAYGEEFTVYCYGVTDTGLTPTPTLGISSPCLQVGDIVRIVRMPAAGATRPAAWWLSDLVFETCYWEEEGGDGG